MQGAADKFDPQSFERCVQHVLNEEKGYSNRRTDPGGPTNLGITQATLDAARELWPDMPRTVDLLTEHDARTIYNYHFWAPIRGDELPAGYALLTLDAAVQHGPHRAARWLQQALGVPADGWIGARTLAAAAGRIAPEVVGEALARRAHFYMLQDSMDDEYGLGWSRRLFRTHRAALQEIGQ